MDDESFRIQARENDAPQQCVMNRWRNHKVQAGKLLYGKQSRTRIFLSVFMSSRKNCHKVEVSSVEPPRLLMYCIPVIMVALGVSRFKIPEARVFSASKPWPTWNGLSIRSMVTRYQSQALMVSSCAWLKSATGTELMVADSIRTTRIQNGLDGAIFTLTLCVMAN